MASKWHFNDFRHVPCRQVLGQALMTKHAQCSPTNLKETTLWQGYFCQVHVSNCKETDSFGAITSIGHQNAKDLKLMGLPNEKSKHVSTAIMYNYVDGNEWNWNMHLHIANWGNMMEHDGTWQRMKPPQANFWVPNLWPTRNLVNTNGSACSTQLPPSSLSSGIWHMVKLRQFLHSGDLKRYRWLRFRGLLSHLPQQCQHHQVTAGPRCHHHGLLLGIGDCLGYGP